MQIDLPKESDQNLVKLARKIIAELVGRGWSVHLPPKREIDAHDNEDYASHFTVYRTERL